MSIMNAMDALSGALGSAFFTNDATKESYHLMELTEFEAKYTPTIVKVPILGQINKGHKAVGGEITWSGTAHFNQSTFPKLMHEYQKTKVMPRFTLQISNHDDSTSVKTQTVILTGCLMESTVIAKLSTGDEFLTMDISGTAEGFELKDEFADMKGRKL